MSHYYETKFCLQLIHLNAHSFLDHMQLCLSKDPDHKIIIQKYKLGPVQNDLGLYIASNDLNTFINGTKNEKEILCIGWFKSTRIHSRIASGVLVYHGDIHLNVIVMNVKITNAATISCFKTSKNQLVHGTIKPWFQTS